MTDGIHSVSAPVEVKIIDTKNNKPEFSKSVYQAVLPETVPKGERAVVHAGCVGLRCQRVYQQERGLGSYKPVISEGVSSLVKLVIC